MNHYGLTHPPRTHQDHRSSYRQIFDQWKKECKICTRLKISIARRNVVWPLPPRVLDSNPFDDVVCRDLLHRALEYAVARTRVKALILVENYVINILLSMP